MITWAGDKCVQLAGTKYVSKFDLCKGYWQYRTSWRNVKKENSFSDTTRTVTVQGYADWFGQRVSQFQRKLLEGMQFIDNFTDNVIIYTNSFQEHLQFVQEFLEGLRATNLTAKTSKCFIEFQSLECLDI